ncbi:CxxH/CxxC protein [Psychrobacillus sp. INOP01]|uniref:CxxH/CxxC protein n=1 Tax=Psychrobacillus sp. INOP01 TaxID=2829187 RepID=UPI001BA7049E|nr:CxxH/CxxC protein [Psychrobacillus sp. INOP01]QUG43656.1 CxxH/CxxC protein [Psychrobacillus sp. INOP01]
MRIFSCENHINHALDMFVAEQKTFPMLEELKNEEKLSTVCSYCESSALYIVANEN